MVVLMDSRNPNADDERKEVGEAIYGGTLVLVHPKGAVSEGDGQLRFHAIGQALQAFKPLTMEEMPEIFDAVRKLQARVEGTSEQPGG